jgi:hypothetical protein
VRIGYGGGNASSCGFGVLVLPDAHDRPSGGTEAGVGIAIARHVAGDLRPPVIDIRLWRHEVHRTGMPEAPIQVNGKLGAGKHQISSPPHIGYRPPCNQKPQAKVVHC